MSEDSPHLRALQLAHRVWRLPHFRMAVFKHIVTLRKSNQNAMTRKDYLRQILTLEKESFREVAMLLYPSIKLDNFPWDCPSEVGAVPRAEADIFIGAEATLRSGG